MKKNSICFLGVMLWAFMIYGVNASDFNGLNIKGDVRLRVQSEKNASDAVSRIRERFRLRLGGKKQVTDMVGVSFGLASGGDDPRSTNQTMENGFQSPDMRIDYAYVDMTPMDSLVLRLGKGKNMLWRPSDLLWDTDINPDGVSGRFNFNSDGFVHFGMFSLDENETSEHDPRLLVVQPGMTIDHGGQAQSKVALSYYMGMNTATTDVTDASGKTINTTDKEETPLVLSYEWGSKVSNRPVKAFAEYVTNQAKDSNNTGFIVGAKIGKAKSTGTWDAGLSYRSLASNAWFGFLPDSDSYGGGTNVKGVEFIYNYALQTHVILGLDVYQADILDGTSDQQLLVQADLNVKF